ncbi:hypothetical protein MYRA21_0064 [Myroides sp. A21]|uniref:hypothetical protein n=1 Tax=Myroides sp. A21 TaxID=1583100 RepID=UPI000585F9D3|nr:hypothetical protein [Myroides sp. A21]AJA67308.1 hypothetical protein MYRA21_0064 [Myroides sp. A21]
MNNIYRFDFKRFIKLFIPIAYRNKTILELFGCFLFPIKQLHQRFVNYRKEVIQKMSYNSQVVYMQKMLNDYFDPFLRRIRIENNSIDDRVLFYTEPRNKPVYFGTQRFFSDRWQRNYDFLVIIPKDVILNDKEKTQMKNLIEYYKLYSKNYEIKYVTT